MPFDVFFPFKWQNLFDILVISFIVHRIFLLLRGTTAFQVVLGLVFLWLFQAIAKNAGLVLTSWFFQGLGAVAVLVIVVVFRSEIRELLIQTNPVRFFLGHPWQKPTIGLGSVVQAVFRLADSKTGALVVLQSRDPLIDHLRDGFNLDGRFNAQIIESLFVKESPVHDGAMIIRGDRITRVGTFLPLTQKEGLPGHYGTRHRAAIGLSERTDAAVLVVSEERGEVSLVQRGEVKLIRHPELLRDALGRSLFPEEQEKINRRRGKAWLHQGAGILGTILLVSTFWGIYSGRQLSLISVTVPIDFRNIPDNVKLERTSTEQIEVQISGKRPLVSGLKPKDIRAFVDLKDIKQGTHKVALNRANVELPPGLEVVRLSPSTLQVELEKQIEKKLAVKPKFVGRPPAGYQIEEVKVSPEYVKVLGPVSAVASVNILYTESIDLDKLQLQESKKTLEVPLVLSPASLRLLPGEPEKVKLTISVGAIEELSVKAQKEEKRYHEVGSGETLWSISQRYGITIEKLRKLNGLPQGAIIHPGDRLLLGPEEVE
jgi:diadenylate cyclase